MSSQPVAIVTGASSGIGMETALALARRGYAVVLAARRADKLSEVADRCRAAHPQAAAAAIVTDVTSQSQVSDLVAQTMERFGRVDVMVNNAGRGLFGPVHEMADQDLRRLFDVNFFGVFYGCRAVAPIMIRQGGGHIFNVSSVIGKRSAPMHGAYCATKFAVCGLSESMRVELRPHGVKVTTVCPALTDTEFTLNPNLSARPGSKYTRRSKRMAASLVGRRIAATVGRTKPELVFTTGGKFLVLLAALWPSAADRIMGIYLNDLRKVMDR